VQQSVETMNSLWQALPFMTFLVGLALGGALMYVVMTLRLWKLRQRLAKCDGTPRIETVNAHDLIAAK
jgi:hypothetical protein